MHDLAFQRIKNAIDGMTMCSDAALRFTVEAVERVVESGIIGDFAECGVWKGGCSAAMAMAYRKIRPEPETRYRVVHLFDSFEGLPPCQPEVDGKAAAAWQKNTTALRYYDNCRAYIGDVQRRMHKLGLMNDIGDGTVDSVVLHKGWFRDSFPKFLLNPPPLAILRIDCDWYESVMLSLDMLMPIVTLGGVVIIDDYYAWDGCGAALHEWFAKNKTTYRLRTIGDGDGVWFAKE